MDWDFTKLEIQDNNTHLSALASSSGSTHGVIHQHHHEDTNMVDHDIFSVDLKLGRVMDDHHPHHRHQYGLTLDAAAAAAAYNPTNYHSGSPTMTLMAAPSPPPLPLSSSTRRSRGGSGGSGPLQPVCCLVDGCTSDLSSCREYHRRHRVCERHSKTPVVLVGGEEQRFCQQCSRFHPLSEFDEVKRSCRKRLDGHNRRRRKTQPDPTICNINSSTSPIHNTTGIFTNSSSPGSALMDFIRNAPHLPVFPPPPTTPWQIPTPLQPQTRSQVDFLLPSSSSSSSSPPYPFMPYGYGGGDQTTRQRSAPRHNTDNNNIHNHQNSVMCHQIMTNNHHTQPLIENSSMSNDNNINCALSLLSSTAMDTTNGANRSSSSTGINVVAGHPFGGFIAPDHHHHLFSSNSQLQQDFEDGTTGSGNYGAVYHHHHHHHSTGAGTTHNFQQRNHGFGHTDSDGF